MVTEKDAARGSRAGLPDDADDIDDIDDDHGVHEHAGTLDQVAACIGRITDAFDRVLRHVD